MLSEYIQHGGQTCKKPKMKKRLFIIIIMLLILYTIHNIEKCDRIHFCEIIENEYHCKYINITPTYIVGGCEIHYTC